MIRSTCFRFYLLLGIMLCVMLSFGQETIDRRSSSILAGPERTLLYLDNVWAELGVDGESTSMPYPSTRIFKSINGLEGNFQPLGSIQFPGSAEELDQRVSALGYRENVLAQLRVSTMEDAYRQLQTWGTDTLGLLLLSPELGEALGLVYIDEHGDVTQSENTVYRIERVSANGQVTHSTYLQGLDVTSLWGGEALRAKAHLPLDSSVTIQWASHMLYNHEEMPLFAEVYRRTGHEGEFTFQQRLLLTQNEETAETTVTFSQEVEPGGHYAYYVQVEDLAGNRGLPSDTVSVLAVDVNQRAFITNLQVTDTLNGLLLTWDPLPSEALYTAIQILKSRQASSEFVVVDTIAAGETAYLDRHVIPSTAYYYRVRALHYNLPAMDQALFAEAQGHKSGENLPAPGAPSSVKASTRPEGVQITWTHGHELNLFAYYVLRGSHPNNMTVISEGIQDTVYIDDQIPGEFTGQMHYAVQVMDMAQQMSEPSAMATVFIRQAVELAAPNGILVNRDVDAVWLEWDHVAPRDPRVVGYYLYRRAEDESYFSRLNENPMQAFTFADRTSDQRKNYIYAVTSTDIYGNESIFSPTTALDKDLSRQLAAPLELQARNLRAGIEVSWAVPLEHDEQTAYVVFRHTGDAQKMEEIGRVSPAERFLDTNVQAGTTYHYVVRAQWNGTFGTLLSPEKSILRREF